MKIAIILLKTFEQEKVVGKVDKILENYDNFVLVEITDNQIRSLENEGIKVVVKNEIENIQLINKNINTTKPRHVKKGAIKSHLAYEHTIDPGPDIHHYLVQFIGPIKEEWKEEIKKLGGTFSDPYPSYSYIVEMDEKSREKINELSFVRWVGHYDYSFRFSPGLLEEIEKKVPTHARISSTHSLEPEQISKPFGSIPSTFSVSFYSTENLKDALPKIKGLGGQIIGEYNNKITISIPEKDLVKNLKNISKIHGVKLIDTVKIRQLHNNIATRIMCNHDLDSALNLSLTGINEIIGVADTGIDSGDAATIHEDFKGRIIGIKSWPISPEFNSNILNPGDDDGPADKWSGHGTHVTGSALGNGQKSNGIFRGLATEASLFFQAMEQLTYWNFDFVKWYRRKYGTNPDTYALTGIPTDLKVLFQEAYDAGVKIHTNSWGGGDFGAYDIQSEDVDRFVWDHKDMVILFAAGNSGIDANRDGRIDFMSITPPATAKNCISVGASENMREELEYIYRNKFPVDPIASDKLADNPDDIAAFSSRGPCMDGRFKPDVVAPGTYIISTRSSKSKLEGWDLLPKTDPNRDHYMYMGGTSMATPLTAGAVALIRQFLRQEGLSPSASLIKAALIHTTVRKPYRYSAVTSASSLWDAEQGWGHVNIEPFIADVNGFKMDFIDGGDLVTGELKEYFFDVSNPSIPFRVTLAYTDYPGNSIINNINLIVTTPNGKDYYGNQASPPYDSAFDSSNNVETVYISEPIPGQYKVTALASDVSVGPKDFSLVISGGVVSGIGEISGTIVDSSNTPVEGAKVSVDSGQNVLTDADGRYKFTEVPGGEHSVTAFKSNCECACIKVNVLENEVALANIELNCLTGNVIEIEETPAKKIPDKDPAGITRTMTVDATGHVKNIEVSVDITHTYIGDLIVTLVSPQGTSIDLHHRVGGGQENIIKTYSTTHELGKLTGESIKGKWRLKVADLVGQDVGKLNRWSLRIIPA